MRAAIAGQQRVGLEHRLRPGPVHRDLVEVIHHPERVEAGALGRAGDLRDPLEPLFLGHAREREAVDLKSEPRDRPVGRRRHGALLVSVSPEYAPAPAAPGRSHLVPAAADGHVAPLAGVVAGAVIERPLALLVGTYLQAGPGSLRHAGVRGGEDPRQRGIDPERPAAAPSRCALPVFVHVQPQGSAFGHMVDHGGSRRVGRGAGIRAQQCPQRLAQLRRPATSITTERSDGPGRACSSSHAADPQGWPAGHRRTRRHGVHELLHRFQRSPWTGCGLRADRLPQLRIPPSHLTRNRNRR